MNKIILLKFLKITIWANISSLMLKKAYNLSHIEKFYLMIYGRIYIVTIKKNIKRFKKKIKLRISMILTKDNLLNFVKQNGAVIPSDVATVFETTTMIASASLSELSKANLIAITKLKLSSSPYYYDLKQKECLIELGLNFYKRFEKDILIQLKDKEVLADNSLTIQERLAIERIKDFAIPLEIDNDGKIILFWVWYLRDINETRKQILNLISGRETPKKQTKKPEKREKGINQKKGNLQENKIISEYEISKSKKSLSIESKKLIL